MDTFFKKIIWLIIAAPAIYLAIVWNKLPATVALHFNLQGTPDRYGPKAELWIFIAIILVISIATYLLLPLSYKIDPKKTAVENKPRLEKLGFTISLFLSFVACVIIHSTLTGSVWFTIKMVFGAIGLMWCIIGNYLYNIRPNYFAGFRVSWTLNNEENWKKTHRVGGIVFFIGGLLIFISSLILSQAALIIIFIAVALITTIVPGAYSYALYRKTKKVN